MAPLKFEDHIKEKLDKRSITPSANAWDKLESQLDTQSKGNKKLYKKVMVLIAASVIFFLMLIPFFEFSKQVNPVVDTVEVVVPESEYTPVITKETRLVESNKEQIETNVAIENLSKSEIKKHKETTPSKIKNKPVHTQPKIATVEKQEVEMSNNVVLSTQNKQQSFIEDSLISQKMDNKVADLLVQVQQIEKNNGQVTDEEINSLLRKAQQEITADKLLEEGKTNALSLLEDVELELDETFKQRVFETLKISFSKLRTAVAERDN